MTAALPTTALALALSLAAPAAHALFKVVGPDGRVTYTDRPPPDSASKVMSVNRSTGSASDPALARPVAPSASACPSRGRIVSSRPLGSAA